MTIATAAAPTTVIPTGEQELVVSLTDSSVGSYRVSPSRVGGKASSLATLYATEGLGAKVPKAHALTVDFFGPWIDELTETDDFRALSQTMEAVDSKKPLTEDQQAMATSLCAKLQASSLQLDLSEAQSEAIRRLHHELNGRLAAVRSSAPEEDGSGASFAGAFETKLAVETTYKGLETAVKECFASLWDYRVLLYKQTQHQGNNGEKNNTTSIGFAVVVMEMVDSVIAGVAFSANPLNSDRDELVIDSSWGLGESVVDGSVTADRYVVDKVQKPFRIIEESLGKKGNEKRLGAGGVVTKSIDEQDPRYSKSSLTPKQIEELSELVCLIETTYGMPMDVEWAFVANENDDKNSSELTPKLLQARPITTLFAIDPEMMTKPGEKRRLYFDFNVLSEATTTTPFTTMDMDVYCKVFTTAALAVSLEEIETKNIVFFQPSDSNSIIYNGRTRQYFNMGFAFKYADPQLLAEVSTIL